MKKCSKCGIEKDLSCFYKKGKYLRSECNDCQKIYKYESKLNNPNKFLCKDAKHRAKKKNIPFDITADDVIIPEVCPILGIPLKAGDKIVCNTSPTIDRIKPELGYVKGNIQVLSYRANMLKSNATIEELEKVLEHLKKIV
jgi:hypothetical protein